MLFEEFNHFILFILILYITFERFFSGVRGTKINNVRTTSILLFLILNMLLI